MAENLNLRYILDTNKLTGPNFMDWYRNVKIVLRSEKKAYVLDSLVPVALAEGQDGYDQYDWEAHRQHLADNEQAVCILLVSISAELQCQHEHMDAPSIILHLQELYDKQGRAERFETSKELFGCKLAEGMAVRPHILKMIGLIEKLASLGLS
ncbi:uncharacterized protein LOC133310514 [Gastrolobium bilobum]|uniref:uncharacterized protein LOC133310514 n=1 Tax=Gastrolobium bilobum TaxID=150636 RepID=UPI002AB0F931|nr:uncharacterized protein LOC133310514 [Gastrolobium bilobum]